MTENEAIESLRYLKEEIEDDSPDMFVYTTGSIEALDVAIKALEEIQKYRVIGTDEYFKECADILNKAESNELAKIIDGWILYHKIGTVAECRESREKQRPKKYKKVQPCKSVNYYQCPCCNGLLHINENFCGECGQAISWEYEE